MAFVINDTCVSCGACAGECPVGAIVEGDGKYEINADSCIDCGTCAGVRSRQRPACAECGGAGCCRPN